MSKNRTVFLVDDDTDDQDFFKSALQTIDNSAFLLSAFNGEHALEMINGGNVDPDIVFLDLNMPRMNGAELLVELRRMESFALIPIILYSTSSERSAIIECMQLGANDYLVKPNKFETLIVEIRTVMDKYLK